MKRTTLLTVVLTIMFAASCTFNSTPPSNIADVDVASFQKEIMTSFDILNTSVVPTDLALTPFSVVAPIAQSRATVPVFSTGSYNLPATGQSSTFTVDGDYPEVDQTTTWTVERVGISNIYIVKVNTTFLDGDFRKNQAEWYYIKDVATLGVWTTDEKICNEFGNENSNYRLKNELIFDDDSVQTERVVETTRRFAPFDVNGGLDYPGAFLPVADATANWSSVVVYTRTFTTLPNFSFWSGSQVKTIVGVRYYTEHLNALNTVLTGSMVVFEKAITLSESMSGDFLNINSSLFLPILANEPNQAILALTVIRQESAYKVNYNAPGDFTVAYIDNSNTRTTRAMTRVVNISAQQDNYITLIDGEAAAITNAYDTLWIPKGDDPAIINLATATTVNVKSSNEVVTTDGSAPVSIVTNSPSGDLGTLYVSIEEGAATSPILLADDIAGDLSGTGDIKTFTGEEGMLLDSPASSYATTKGTLQAWVYLNGVSDTPGIVHAGVLPDFSDELWTLQFMGTSTAPVFGLVAQGPYKYDLITSTQKLNLNKWHHVVTTWDLAANSMKMYVDGRARGSAGFTNVKTTSTFATGSSVIIGSQLYSPNVLPGYYGFNGKINGVLINNWVWTATEISNFYAANKANTVNW